MPNPSTIFAVPGLSEAVTPNPAVTAFPIVDTFTLDGVEMPGKWVLLKAMRIFTFQIQEGYALDYAATFPIGAKLVRASFRGEFWGSADYKLFLELSKRFMQTPLLVAGVFAGAHGIDHPELKRLGMTGAIVENVHATVQESGGLWVTHLDFLEFKKPKLPPPKPTFVVPDVSQNIPTAKSAQEAELLKLQGQVDSLKGAFTGR